ncbi:MAG: RsmD family RNA methyltransferase [Candidatus Aenigmarchaeota archaeon]|nr:RsmD family RNA methyltransferase [Candidatus Aenigmarchaeota archaeon]
MEFIEVKEGKTILNVPKEFLVKRVFYNPVMELVRDMNVVVTKCWIDYKKLKNKSYLDLLSGTGANGVRIANETNVEKVYLNEISSDAIKLTKKNIESNGLQNKTTLLHRNAKRLYALLDQRFGFVDVDPFGSPIYYIPYIYNFLDGGSLLSTTATDTRTLFGLKEDTALRRYAMKTVPIDFYREYGVRVLATSIILTLSRYSILARPIFGYSKRHFVKVYFEIDVGRSKLNKFLKENISFLNYCTRCLWREYSNEPIGKCGFCGKEAKVSYPIYSGKLFDEKFAEFVIGKKEEFSYLKNSKEIFGIFENVENENISNHYFDVHEFARKYRIDQIPSLENISNKLKENGFVASRTVFSKTAIRTNASFEDFVEALGNPKIKA